MYLRDYLQDDPEEVRDILQNMWGAEERQFAELLMQELLVHKHVVRLMAPLHNEEELELAEE